MDTVRDWAASGAVALTGRADGPPLLPPGRAAGRVREQLATLGFEIPGLLGERAAYAGLRRRGPWSCGGAFRTMPTLDGHIGLSLARPSDVELVPALVEGAADDPWAAVADWAAGCSSREADERIRLLDLPGGAVPAPSRTARPGVLTSVLGRRTVTAEPLVVDLTALWAGPLCAHLLGLRGARVVKVESAQRPDGARRGARGFFDLLHHGHEQRVVDFDRDADRLRDLLGSADLVLEGSRPRALRRLGISAEEIVAGGTSWLSITARGRQSTAVGFGDDVASAAGLFVTEPGAPDLLPVGDAIADPLAGVAAAVAAADALASAEARLVDVSMLHVVAETLTRDVPEHAVVRRDSQWWIDYDGGSVRVREPRRRP
ncbi:CoA transferase [Nocardia nova]|uniref:CoA transferase n=1 Tax=Nocardia nova TaxID=37330 RepID=UPI0033DCDA1B